MKIILFIAGVSLISSATSQNCKITISDKCVDVEGMSRENGTPIQVYDCNGTPAQDWMALDDGSLRALDKCMTLSKDESFVELYDCDDSVVLWDLLSNGLIMNMKSRMCLDIQDGEIERAKPLILSDCDDNIRTQIFANDCNQRTTTTTTTTTPAPPPTTGICKLTISGKCIDVSNRKMANGTPIQLYDCNGTPAQDWLVSGDGSIRALSMCMDVTDGKVASGTKIQLYTCNNTPAQQFQLLPNGLIRNTLSNKCLDVEDGVITKNQRLVISDCDATKVSTQVVAKSCDALPTPRVPPTPGTCTIKSSRMCVDVFRRKTANGTPVQMYECNETPAQDWTVRDDGTIRALGKCMDVTGGKINNGTPIQLYDCNRTGAQQWKFLPSGQIQNTKSMRCLDVEDGVIQNGKRLIIKDCYAPPVVYTQDFRFC